MINLVNNSLARNSELKQPLNLLAIINTYIYKSKWPCSTTDSIWASEARDSGSIPDKVTFFCSVTKKRITQRKKENTQRTMGEMFLETESLAINCIVSTKE